MIGVVAEAGVGKSRLCDEFVKRRRAEGIRVTEAHCPADGKAIPFPMVLGLFRDFFEIADRDSDPEARRKISGSLVLLDEAFQEMLPLVFDFLGVADPERPAPQIAPERRQRQLYAFVRQIVQARSQQEPAVILIDDVHWIDEGSDGFLAQLVEATGSTRTLVLVNFRPEYTAEWFHKSYYQRLPLAPLGAEDVAAMVADLLGSDAVGPLPDLIIEKTAGNPFFTEELVRTLVESDALEGERGAYRLTRSIEDLEIPSTVRALLEARIDRLPEQDKQVLHTAAVVGREFSEPLLAAVVDLPDVELASSLSRLQFAEFILEQAIYPVAEYTFKHPLTEQVARESQLKERRSRIHATVARHIEAAHADKLDENAALIAHHWEQARDALEAARWHRRAAEWAAQRDIGAALRHWQRVPELARELSDSPERAALGGEACAALVNLGWRVGGKEEAQAQFREGLRFAEQTGDTRLLALLHGGFGAIVGLLNESDFDAYVRHSREAVRFAEQTGNLQLVRAMKSYLMYATWFAGETAEPRHLAEELIGGPILTAAERAAGGTAYDPRLAGLQVRGHVRFYQGDFDGGEADIRRGIELAREVGDHWAESTCAAYLVVFGDLRGERDSVLDDARTSVEAAERLSGDVGQQTSARLYLGLAHVLRREWYQARSVLEECLAFRRDTGVSLWQESDTLRYLACALHGAQEPERAVALAREAAQLRGAPVWSSIDSHCTLARVRGPRSNEPSTASPSSSASTASGASPVSSARSAPAWRTCSATTSPMSVNSAKPTASTPRWALRGTRSGWGGSWGSTELPIGRPDR